jgi:hypothetical protein
MSRYSQYSVIYRQQFSPAENAGLRKKGVPGSSSTSKKRVPPHSFLSQGFPGLLPSGSGFPNCPFQKCQ